MALTKVSGGILDPGINVAGIVTATGFDGPFTGGSSRNITAGIVTATGLDINGNGDISGNLVVGGNLTANGDFTTLNTTLREVEILHVSAGSTTTAGIITQTGTGDILNLYDDSTEVFSVADGGLVEVKARAADTKRVVLAGSPTNTTFQLAAYDGATGTGAGTTQAKFGLFYNNDENAVLKFERGSGAPDGALTIHTNNTEQLRFSSNGDIKAGWGDKFIGVYHSADYYMGATFEAAGSTNRALFIDNRAGNGRGDIVFRTGVNQAPVDRLTIRGGGNVGIGSTLPGEALVVSGITSTTHLNVTGVSTFVGVSTFQDHVNVVQGKRINFGSTNGTNGHIYYDGSTTRLQTNQGLNIGAPVISLKGAGLVGVMGEFIQNGAVQLYHNNLLRLETDANGVQIKPNIGGVTQLGIAQTTTTAYSINGTISFINSSNTTAQIRGRTGSASTTGDLIFLCNTIGDETLAVLEDGKVRVPDRGSFVVGQGNDLTLKHDGDHSTITNTTGNLTITNSGSTYSYIDSNFFRLRSPTNSYSHMIQVDASGANQGVRLFHAPGVVKLITTGIGVSVIGEVAASQDYPNFRPTLDFNFVAEKKLDPRITYQRTGPASFTNEFGKVVLIGDNSPRFDHNPTTRDCKGLLCEESRKNYLENGDFVSSYGSGNSWAYGVGTDVFSASSGSQLSTNPDGSSPAYHYAPSSTAGYHRFNRTFTVDAYDTSYVVSVFAKRVTEGSVSSLNRYLEIEISGNFALNGAPTGHSGTHGMSGITYDLQDGVVENASTNNYGYVGDAKMEKFADDWWRLSYVFNPGTNDGSSSLTGSIWFGHPTSVGSDDGSETGNGNPSFYLWGAMIEKGDFLTSYIPNHGAYQATRGVDITQIEDQEFTEFYNSDEWTMITDTNLDNIKSVVASPSAVNSINFEGDDNTKKFQTRYVTSSTDNQGYVDVIGAMSGTTYFDLTGATVGTYNVKTALAAKVNDVAVSHNGETVQSDTTVTMLENPTRMNIGENPKQFHIKRIMYYPKRLPNNQLRTLTS